MADITLISGSTLGGAEYVAEHLAEKLEEAGFTTETLHGPLLEDLSASGIWLVISSTHGAGDIPDNSRARGRRCFFITIPSRNKAGGYPCWYIREINWSR